MPRVPGRIIGVAVLALVGASLAMGNPVRAAPRAVVPCTLPQDILGACLQHNFDQSLTYERWDALNAGFTTPIGWYPTPHWHDIYPVREISPDNTADLNADGRPDVIQMDFDNGPTTLTVRDGASGHRYWERTYANLIGFTPVRVGTPARSGIIVAELIPDSDPTTPGQQFRLKLTGLDGATGATLWTAAHAYSRSDPTEANGSQFSLRRVLAAASGKAARIVTQRPYVIDGSNGSVRELGNEIVYPDDVDSGYFPETWRHWLDVGDVDHDGYDDALVPSGIVQGEINPHSQVRSSTTGKTLLALPRGPFLAARHVNGDGFSDLGYYMEKCTANDSDGGCLHWTSTLSVYDGHTGSLRWSRSRQNGSSFSVYPIGDANHDGLQEWLDDGVGIARSGATGNAIWTDNWRAPSSWTQCSFNRLAPSYPTPSPRPSDVQGDGTFDNRLGVFAPPGASCDANPTEVIQSLSNGAVLEGPALGCCALDASYDGNGQDYAAISTADGATNVLNVDVKDGLTRATLWTFQRALSRAMTLLSYHTRDLTGDGHPDLVVADCAGCSERGTAQSDLVVIDGATHQTLWTSTS